jgi:hypothetical protein
MSAFSFCNIGVLVAVLIWNLYLVFIVFKREMLSIIHNRVKQWEY